MQQGSQSFRELRAYVCKHVARKESPVRFCANTGLRPVHKESGWLFACYKHSQELSEKLHSVPLAEMLETVPEIEQYIHYPPGTTLELLGDQWTLKQRLCKVYGHGFWVLEKRDDGSPLIWAGGRPKPHWKLRARFLAWYEKQKVTIFLIGVHIGLLIPLLVSLFAMLRGDAKRLLLLNIMMGYSLFVIILLLSVYILRGFQKGRLIKAFGERGAEQFFGKVWDDASLDEFESMRDDRLFRHGIIHAYYGNFRLSDICYTKIANPFSLYSLLMKNTLKGVVYGLEKQDFAAARGLFERVAKTWENPGILGLIESQTLWTIGFLIEATKFLSKSGPAPSMKNLTKAKKQKSIYTPFLYWLSIHVNKQLLNIQESKKLEELLFEMAPHCKGLKI